MSTSIEPGDSPLRAAELAACRGLLDALPEAAWVFELVSRRVLLANDPALALLGVEASALIGSAVDGVLSTPEDLAYWMAFDPDAPAALKSETVIATAGGRLVHCLRSVRAMPGSHWGLVCLHDISAHRRAEDERESLLAELQATLEAAGDGLLVTDRDGQLRSCNRRLAEIFGMPPVLFERR